MKFKSILLPIIFFALFSIQNISLYSHEDVECIDNCPGDVFGPIQTTFITIGGCTYQCDWQYRETTCEPTHWCQFKLVGITEVGGTGCAITAANRFTIFQGCMYQIMQSEAPNTNCTQGLANGECKANHSFTYASCWKVRKVGVAGKTQLKPCTSKVGACCWDIYNVCKDLNGIVIVTPGPHIGVNPDCQSDWYDEKNMPGDCIGMCEEPPPSNIQIPSGIHENVNHETGYKSKVFPNPTDAFLNIQLNAETEGEHVVEIIDLTGNILFSQDFTKRGNEILIQLDLSKFSSGNYKYVIKQNGTPKINGSFNIVK